MPDADRLIEIFNEAKARPAGSERDAFLAEACGDDGELRTQVFSLLRAYESAGEFLRAGPALSPEIEAELARLKPEEAGEWIGPYKLREQIGAGGFGAVWVAEQQTPVRRTVALKIIKLGMDTHEVVARFEQERQALAMMDHPNIARVFDAGATEHGRPFFAMELVRGIKITDYCDQANLPTAERLALFITVCHAVQHAHQKGIIHRDLKPSNILVTLHDGVPVPKVIDFGVAKATQGRLGDFSIYTQFQQMIGTPLYMSPEQAEMSGLDVDTRTDIYALGVLLYELLTGRTPFDAAVFIKAGHDEMRRIIREQEPQKPSTALHTMALAKLTAVAHHRASEPPKLIHAIHGDLDWIVMKTLEKDRARRYDTANGLAADIQRHLENKPVSARPPSAGYRFQKLVRRNKLAFAAATAVAAVLVLGIFASTWQAVRATRAEREQSRLRAQAETARNNEARARASAEANEQKAEAEAARSRQVAQFMQDMLKGVGPSAALGRDTTMLREILDQTVRRLAELKGQPAVEADLRTTLGDVYRDLGDYPNAAAMHREALALRRKLLGEEHPDVAAALNNLANVLLKQGHRAEAEATYREALAMRRKFFGNEHWAVAESLRGLSEVFREQGKLADAETAGREMLAIYRTLDGNEHVNVADALHALAWNVHSLSKHAEAEALSREEQAIWRKLFGHDHHRVGWALGDLAIYLSDQGKLPEAEATAREALVIQRQRMGSDPGGLGRFLRQLAWVLHRQGKMAEGEALLREELALHRKVLGQEHPDVADTLFTLAVFLRDQGKLPEAETALRESLAIQHVGLGDNHPTVSKTLNLLAELLRAQHRMAEAEALWREELASRRKTPDGESPEVAHSLQQFALLLRDLGKLTEAETTMRESLTIRRKRFGNEHPDVAWALHNLADVLRHQWKLPEAETVIRESLAIRRALLGNEHIEVAWALTLLTYILRDQARLTEAETAARESFALHRKRFGDASPDTAGALKNLAMVLGRQGNFAEAKTLFLAAAEHANAHTLNEIAWALATGPSPKLRDGPAALSFAEKAVAGTNRKDAIMLDTLAAAHAEIGHFSQAVRVQQEAAALEQDPKRKDGYLTRVKLYESELPYRDHLRLAEMAKAMLDGMKPAEAESPARECLALRERIIPGDWRVFNARSLLGASLLGQKRFTEAEPLLLSAYEGIKEREDKIPAAGKVRLKETLQRLVQFYEATGQSEKAAEWNWKLAEFDKAEAEKGTAVPRP